MSAVYLLTAFPLHGAPWRPCLLDPPGHARCEQSATADSV